ncbi:hypothetical protein PENSPDRAFT_672309 [Peniophora sp. CONT]|nr:hypothetical protein PENSPDRAFT_672309 [Peniophora sp. CONT]
MVRLRSAPATTSRSSRKSLAMRQFRAEVRAQAHPVDREVMRELRARCQRHGHLLIGPRLQYKEDCLDRGRYYALAYSERLQCKEDHPGESQLQPAFAQLEKRRIAIYQQLVGAPPSQPRQARDINFFCSFKTSDSLFAATILRKPPGFLLDTYSAARSAQRRARSPSVDVALSPKAPVPAGYRGVLRVQLYAQDQQPPTLVKLHGSANTAYYLLDRCVRSWNEAEVKLSDRVKILTYADDEMQVWQPATLGEVAISAFYGGVVIAHDRVRNFHSSLNSYLDWACADPVTDLSTNSDVPAGGKWVY